MRESVKRRGRERKRDTQIKIEKERDREREREREYIQMIVCPGKTPIWQAHLGRGKISIKSIRSIIVMHPYLTILYCGINMRIKTQIYLCILLYLQTFCMRRGGRDLGSVTLKG